MVSSLWMSASWVSMPTVAPRTSEIVPESGSRSPQISLNSVDLPLPFTPTRPMRCPACRVRFTSLSTSFMAKDLFTFCNVRSIIWNLS